MKPTGTVAVTGVTGFVGNHVARAFIAAGWRTIGLCRQPARQAAVPGLEFRAFDLNAASTVDLSGATLLVHCALEPYRDAGGDAESINVRGSRRLFENALVQGVERMAFISSIAAREGSSSDYGTDKLRIERFLDLNRDIVVRPGLIVGDGGLFRAMYLAIRKRGIAPLFFGGRSPVYTVGIDDLTRALVELVQNERHGLYVLAAPEPVSLKELYLQLARKCGVRVRLIPLPYAPVLFAVSLLERFGLTLPVSSGSIKGVAAMQQIEIPTYAGLDAEMRPLAPLLEGLSIAERRT